MLQQRELYLMLCDELNNKEVQKGGDVYISMLIHIAIHYKLTQHWKATTFQWNFLKNHKKRMLGSKFLSTRSPSNMRG